MPRKSEPALDDLGKRIKAARGANDPNRVREPATDARGAAAGAGVGLRIAVDLVAGVVVGVLIGWQLDNWLETKPWMLLLFTIVGFCGGLLNVVRTANQLEAKRKEEEAARRAEHSE